MHTPVRVCIKTRRVHAHARARQRRTHIAWAHACVMRAGGPRTISPAKRLNVRGMRMCGLTSISTFFSVWM